MASSTSMPVSARRSSWSRRALFQVHLWTGLALGLYAVAISVSGSILVYAPQLGAWAHPQLREVPAGALGGRPAISPSTALERVRTALPGRPLLNIQIASEPDRAHVVGLLEHREYLVVFVHPATGQVSPPVHGRGAALGWIERLHSNFFSGRPGRVANGIGGLLLVLLAASGIVIWWPGRGQFARALRIDWGAGWKRVVFDLHNALGIWLLVPVLVLSVTGAYFTWPQVYRDVVSRVSPVTRRQAPRSTVPVTPGPSVTLDTVIARARQANPAQPAIRVDLPGTPTSPYVVVATRAPEDGARASTTTFVDRYSGAVLEVRRGGQPATWGDAVIAWLAPLHTGHFGGPVVHVVWAVLGLAPTVLFVTGLLMWWNRVIVPRRRQMARASTGA
jgi:uncharacterized iron-regulated membrane protein